MLWQSRDASVMLWYHVADPLQNVALNTICPKDWTGCQFPWHKHLHAQGVKLRACRSLGLRMITVSLNSYPGKVCCLSSRTHSFGPVSGPYLYCRSDWMWMFVFHVSLIWRNHSLVSVFSHHHLHSLLSEECLIMLAMFHNHYTNLHCQLLMECLIE